MKRLVVSDITNTIYLSNVKDLGGGLVKTVGEKHDYTDEAIKAVFQWFVNNFSENEPNEAFEVTFKSSPYILRMVKKDEESKLQKGD